MRSLQPQKSKRVTRTFLVKIKCLKHTYISMNISGPDPISRHLRAQRRHWGLLRGSTVTICHRQHARLYRNGRAYHLGMRQWYVSSWTSPIKCPSFLHTCLCYMLLLASHLPHPQLFYAILEYSQGCKWFAMGFPLSDCRIIIRFWYISTYSKSKGKVNNSKTKSLICLSEKRLSKCSITRLFEIVRKHSSRIPIVMSSTIYQYLCGITLCGFFISNRLWLWRLITTVWNIPHT